MAGAGLDTIRSIILETLLFDGVREPLASVDLVGGAISPTINGRKLAMMVASVPVVGASATTVSGGAAADLGGPVVTWVEAIQALYNPALSQYERQRTPSTFLDSGMITAVGVSNIWTPAGGKKFRLHAYLVEVQSNSTLAAGAGIRFNLTDGATNLGHGHRVFVPAAAGPTGPPLLSMLVAFGGNGLLSSTANNILGCNLVGAAFTNGGISIQVWGNEE